MKVISYPHYTCGGLLCDILNNTNSGIRDGGFNNRQSQLGKLPDVNGMLFEFDQHDLLDGLRQEPEELWVGTHCWLGGLDLDLFDSIINISTLTYKSRLYRWMRSGNHWYKNSHPWQGLNKQELIDKQRETAKNYLQSFPAIDHPKVINIDFADVVEHRPSFLRLIGPGKEQYLEKWKLLNDFLYQDNILQSDLALRFHEAEYESSSGQCYVYQ